MFRLGRVTRGGHRGVDQDAFTVTLLQLMHDHGRIAPSTADKYASFIKIFSFFGQNNVFDTNGLQKIKKMVVKKIKEHASSSVYSQIVIASKTRLCKRCLLFTSEQSLLCNRCSKVELVMRRILPKELVHLVLETRGAYTVKDV